MKISLIIPNYNGKDLLKKNLPRVINSVINDKFEVELVLTDDGSTDDSLEVAKNILAKIKTNNFSYKIIKNNINRGFSSNVNNGVLNTSGEILILINTDIIPEKGFLKPLLKHFSDPEIFAVGCMDKSVENGKIILRGRGVGNWKKGFLVHSRGDINHSSTLWVSGGSGAFRKSIWEKLGGLNQLYDPFYWEDIDLSYRAIKSGFKVLFEKESIVLHEHEKGVIKSRYSKFNVKTIAYRNQFIFTWTNLTDNNLILEHIVLLPYYLISMIINLDFAFFLGFFKALFLLPEIIKSRSVNKKLFTKKDREVIAEFI